MVTLLDAFGLGFILLAHTIITALLTRFFRVRMHTRWGGFLYAAFVTPFVLVATTLLLSGVFALGPDLGSAAAVVAIVIFLPVTVGLTFDYVWMPAPDEVELPEKWEREDPEQSRRERLRP
jgi:hypothetical protein